MAEKIGLDVMAKSLDLRSGLVESREAAMPKARIVIIQGMADLPGWANELVAKGLGSCCLYDPKWHDGAGLETKLAGLKQVIETVNKGEGPLIIVGISAGGGLGLEYILRYGKSDFRHMYTVGGVLSPDPDTQQLEHLTSTSVGFKEMAYDLAKRERELSTEQKVAIKRKITAYSAGDRDGIVPKAALEPRDLARVVRVAGINHMTSIGLTLATAVKREIDGFKQNLREGKFE